jgi:hypothetical protein
LQEKNLSRSTINNYSFSLKNIMKCGENRRLPISIDEIPYYFDEEDVLRIFSEIRNIKHLAMLQTLSFGCLKHLSYVTSAIGMLIQGLGIKGMRRERRREGIVLINAECATILRRYLSVCPKLEIDGSTPLFQQTTAEWTKRGLHTSLQRIRKSRH